MSSTPSSKSNTTIGSLLPRFEFDAESLESSRLWRAAIAGSLAGLIEHSFLYPVDTVKTRMQAASIRTTELKYRSSLHCISQIIRSESVFALFRGWPAVVVAAVPSHGAYFGAYELSKYKLGAEEGIHPFKIALSGAFAAMAHDAIVTPFDVVKQRMQVQSCPYPNVCSCALETMKNEGYISFFRSYPTTVLLNIPTFSTNFVVYETAKVLLKDTILGNEEDWRHHLIAGGAAGGVAGFASNPLDVVRTSIQTERSVGYQSLRHTISKLMAQNPHHPYGVFLSGAAARTAYFIPSAAITWTVYEAFKTYLGFPIHDLPLD